MPTKCPKCSKDMNESEIVKLKCEHFYCWICLNDYLKAHISAKIKCPYNQCSAFIRDAIIRKVLNEQDILKYEEAGIKKPQKSFSCLLLKCSTPVFYTDPNIQYECGSCSLINCILCNTCHGFEKCAVFKLKSQLEKDNIIKTELQNAEEKYNKKMGIVYRSVLLELENVNLLPNDEIFTCGFCSSIFGKGTGIKLQNCLHNICKVCLVSHINQNNTVPIPCPYCVSIINDREIKSVLAPTDFTIYERRCKNVAMKNLKNHFQCKMPDCDSIYDITNDAINEFRCKKCFSLNCIKCKAIHLNMTCQQYQGSAKNNKDKAAIEKLTASGKCMICPKCQTVIKKTIGCNWIQCSNCQIELCWVRKMLRWGPNGSGDTSDGCRCMVDNKPCDPKCILPYCTPHNRTLLQAQTH